jgi:hypothetical protein
MFISLSKKSLEQRFFSHLLIGVFVYHECTMRQHAEMGDVLTGKLLKKNVEYTNQILFHLYQDPADCQFSRKKKRDLRIYDPFAINKIKLKFY